MKAQLNTMYVVYDIETYDKDRAIAYAIGYYPVSKIVTKWNRDLTQTEIDKCGEKMLELYSKIKTVVSDI